MNSTVVCTVCEAVTGLIAAEANMGNATVAALSGLVMAMCTALGGKVVRSECSFLVKNIDKIVSLIDHGMNNTEACKHLKLC